MEYTRDWKVVRKGTSYCSPACGMGCKYTQYLKMKKEAERMCKELGEGWKPRIHENMGWHCSVVKGQAHINYYEDRSGANLPDSYSAWIEIVLSSGTLQFINDHKDFKKALELSKKQARKCIKEVTKELSLIEI